MRLRTLLYHDVVAEGRWDESGFAGGDANAYKFSTAEFARHMAAVHAKTGGRAVTVGQALTGRGRPSDFLITFDDGGIGAIRHAAGVLEACGSRGHFFVTTNCIGKQGFMSADDLVELVRRGHVVGSHSCSHPTMMSRLSVRDVQREWSESISALASAGAGRVNTASVPGGFFSRRVAEAAAEVGIEMLFTSEPTSFTRNIAGCNVLGRYSVQRGVTETAAAALAAGDLGPTLRQWGFWNAKKILKLAGGRSWFRIRQAVQARRFRS